MISLRSIAGRHQADMNAARAAAADHTRACSDLAEALSCRGCRLVAEMPNRYGDHAIAIKTRIGTSDVDHQWIRATLADLDWTPDPKRECRINAKYEVLRLRHISGAELLLIICLPMGQVEQWEAA